MKHRELRNRFTGQIIISGHFASDTEMIEACTDEKIGLDFADFSNLNLINANLDNTSLLYAKFHNCLLSNANLSECDLSHTSFENCILDNATLCESKLYNTKLTACSLLGCDISYALLMATEFRSYSALCLDFQAAENVQDCVLYDEQGNKCRFSQPPVVLNGLPQRIAIVGEMIHFNGTLFDIRKNDLSKPLQAAREIAFLVNSLRDNL